MQRYKLYAGIVGMLVLVILAWFVLTHSSANTEKKHSRVKGNEETFIWKAPDTTDIPQTGEGNMIRYGRNLIAHTARYFGPEGKISQAANGMNCQNCHVAAGTRLLGNNFCLVASSYPKYRNRGGSCVSIVGRINGCMERSMNGLPIDSASREMKALIAYMKWIGKDVPQSQKVFGVGVEKLLFLNRAADSAKGRVVFETICGACHGKNGQGQWNSDLSEYQYPPLWGPHSYNTGAGLYRISKFAGYVKNNMPFGTTYHAPVLTNEEAWDVAAFVNSQPRPQFRDLQNDWPDISQKPIDYPFGPYADTFTERQHKYGPFTKMTEGAKRKILKSKKCHGK